MKHKNHQITTYKHAQELAHLLNHHGVKVQPETFQMVTSGIYIPRWEGDDKIPHEWNQDTQVAKWYFFLRFEKPYKDLNVGEGFHYLETHGIIKLIEKIRHSH